MGNYASNAQLIARFADEATAAFLTDSTNSTADADVLTEVIETAESEIDSYLSSRYDTPVSLSGETNLANVLKGKTLDLAQFYLMDRKGHAAETNEKRADKVIDWLVRIVDGDIPLPGADSVPASTQAKTGIVFGVSDADASTSSRLFTRGKQARL